MQLLRRWWVYPLILIGAVVLVFSVFSSMSTHVETDLDDFIVAARAGDVTAIEVSRDEREIRYKLEGYSQTHETRKERSDSLRELLLGAGFSADEVRALSVRYDEGEAGLVSLALNFLPIFIILGILVFFLRMAQRAQTWRWQLVGLVMNVDPICRATVNPGSANGTSTFQGVTYHFCSAEHKGQFDSNPVKYLLQK